MIADKMSEFMDILVKECSKLDLTSSVSDIHAALTDIYRTIKNCARNSEYSRALPEELEKIIPIVKSLILLLVEDDIPADAMLLCGTCLSLLVATLFDSKSATSFLFCIYCHFNENYSGKQTISTDAKESFKNEMHEIIKSFLSNEESFTTSAFNVCTDSPNLKKSSTLRTPSFQQIAILNGIVSCQNLQLYEFQLTFSQNKPFLLFLFSEVHKCCLSPSVHQYHAFTVLLNWLRMCNMFLHNFHNRTDVYFSEDGEIVQKILNLLESNWQSPVKGINGFIKDIYRSIIMLNEKECKLLGVEDMHFVKNLLEKTMVLSWQVKGKYFLLSVVLQYIDYCKFLEDYSDAPTHIIFSLKANYISSSVAEVYKVIVTNMMKSTSEEDICSKWCNWWRDPILESLHSNDRLLIQNVTNNVLPWTMKKLPKTYQLMMELENQNPDDSVKLLLLRIAKENFFLSLSEKELSLIEKNLHHIDVQVRTEVFSILCTSPKKSEPVKSNELAFIKIFILENLNIDSAPFHQYLLSQVHTLLIRIRDSLAQQHRSVSQNNAAKLDLNQLKFVDWLTHTAVQNTFPGACFQRRRLSLQLLNVIYNVFIESPLGNKRKEKPSKSVENVIKWAQANNLWLFFKNDLLTHILPCITDFADEIRSLCANLLCTYSSWPTMKSCEEKEAVMEFAVELCNHFDFRNNDGGAHICHIIFNRLSLQVEKEMPNQALEFLRHLVSITELQLESAKEDFLSAAVSKPIHGMLLALQYCLADSKSVMKSYQFDKKEAVYFFKNLASLCFNVVKFMLKIMKGENESYFCPSFSDIGKTFEKLVLAKKNLDDSALADDKFDNNENSDCVMMSDLLLSCCWHSIKNSCFLLCELSASILVLDIDFEEKRQFLYEISKEFSSILIACRHRGVVEACSLALNKFCMNLLKDKKIYEDITMGLLQSVFESLTDSTSVSVTRRSAGLPLLFQAVVSSEENNINRQLLSYTIDSLLQLIDKPLPSPDSISEKTDLPQAHAYHILKALVLDARFSQSILPYFDAIIPVCITAFSSSVWAIRNGALQLFGAILPRVCGQKKVRDDDSEHNMVSAFELFARCPNMKDYLLQELNKCVKVHYERKLCSELVPILSLLVKLVPEREDQRIFMIDFIPLLLKLLDIPVWKVRDLASSALSVLLPTNEIVGLLNDIIKKLESDGVKLNKIHSLLLIVRKFMRRKCDNILSNLTTLETCLVSIFTIVHRRKNCPLLLDITIDMIILVADTKGDLNILECVNKSDLACDTLQTQLLGASFCESKSTLVALKCCTHQSLPLYLKKVSSKNKEVKIICLQFLCDKLNSEKSEKDFYSEDNLKIWREIFISALEYISPVMHPSVIIKALNFMIYLCVDCALARVILDGIAGSVIEILKYPLDGKSGLSASALAFTMYSICLRHIIQNPEQCFKEHLEKWCLLWSSYCQPRSTDVLRLEAAKSVAVVGPSLAKYLANSICSDNFVKILIELCEGSLLLLQDEDEDIRYEACKFPSKLPHDYQASALQFNIGIEVIFQYMLEVLHCKHFYVFYLWNRLQNYPSTTKVLQSYCTMKKSNLFEQEYVNVFAEPQQIILLHQQNFKAVLTNLMKENPKMYDESISMFLCDLEVELQDVHSVLSSIGFKNSNQSFTYHHQVYLALKKLRCQVESLLSEQQLASSHEPLHSRLIDLKDKWTEIENLLPSVTCWFLNKF